MNQVCSMPSTTSPFSCWRSLSTAILDLKGKLKPGHPSSITGPEMMGERFVVLESGTNRVGS
jgi:hypothetical protein